MALEEATGQDAAAPEEWRSFRGDPALTGVAPGTLSDQLRKLWHFEAGGKAVVSTPAIADGAVFFGCDDGRLYCVELDSGEQRWSFQTEDVIEAAPLVHGGIVYIGSQDCVFYAVDVRTGEQRWKRQGEDQFQGGAAWVPAPEGEGSWIVIGCYDYRVYCFDALTGESQWTYETGERVNGTAAVGDGKVVFGGCDTYLHVVDVNVGLPLNKVPLSTDSYVAGSVALDGGVAYFGHHGNAFVAVDIATAEPRWVYVGEGRSAFQSSPALTADRVVFGGQDRKLHCLDRETGEVVWTYKTRKSVDASPVVCGDKVVIGTGDSRLRLLALEDGAEIWEYDLGCDILSSPAVAAGKVAIGTHDGVFLFGAATPKAEGNRP